MSDELQMTEWDVDRMSTNYLFAIGNMAPEEFRADHAKAVMAKVQPLLHDWRVLRTRCEQAEKELYQKPCCDPEHEPHPCGEWLRAEACRVSKTCPNGRALAALSPEGGGK